MVYDDRERSEEDAAPIELYQFTVYESDYLFTTASTRQTVELRDYEPQPMRRSSPEATTEIPKQNLTISAAADHPMTAFYTGNPPSTVVLLRILRLHRGDATPQPFWAGRVLNCEWRGDEAHFYCESIYTSLRRTGLRRLYGRGCPYVLYGDQCKADEELFKSNVTLLTVDGNTLTGTAFGDESDGRYTGGLLSVEQVSGEVVRRAIIEHVGTSIKVTHAIAGLEAGDVVQAFPGCAHDLADCNDFFANTDNYGGLAPFMQKLNPFGGGNVF